MVYLEILLIADPLGGETTEVWVSREQVGIGIPEEGICPSRVCGLLYGL